MKYSKAILLKEKNKNLIGTTDERGFKVGDLIILPSDNSLQNRFLRYYLMNDHELPYQFKPDEDVVLWALDTEHFEDSNVLFYSNIEE
jgi:hypothetical protein